MEPYGSMLRSQDPPLEAILQPHESRPPPPPNPISLTSSLIDSLVCA
jgi:hypothetical protein